MTTEPANDAVLEQSPQFVLLRFDEPVETAFGAIRVYDDRAHRVDSGKVEQPSGKEVRIQLAQRPGSGHLHRDVARGVGRTAIPSRGRSSSTSARRVRIRPAWRRRCSDGGTPRSVTIVFSIVRALDFLLLLLVGGGTLLLVAGLERASAEVRTRLVEPACGLRRCARRDRTGRDRRRGREGRRLRARRGSRAGMSSRPSWGHASVRSGLPRPASRSRPRSCSSPAGGSSRWRRRRSCC